VQRVDTRQPHFGPVGGICRAFELQRHVIVAEVAEIDIVDEVAEHEQPLTTLRAMIRIRKLARSHKGNMRQASRVDDTGYVRFSLHGASGVRRGGKFRDPLALAAGKERFGPCPVDSGIQRFTGQYFFGQGPELPGRGCASAPQPRPGADRTFASGPRRVRAPDSPPLPAPFTSALSASQEAGPRLSTQMTRVNGTNAQKNTGPLSPGGKTNSSRTAKKGALF